MASPVRTDGVYDQRPFSADVANLGPLEAILRASQSGLTVQDFRGALLFANDTTAHLSGYPSGQDLMKAPVADLQQRFAIYDVHGQPLTWDQLLGRRTLLGTASARLRYVVQETGEEQWSVVNATPFLAQKAGWSTSSTASPTPRTRTT